LSRPGSGLYWQVSVKGQMARSRSLWDQTLRPDDHITGNDWHFGKQVGPFEPRVYVVSRYVRADATLPPVLVQVAIDARPLYLARMAFQRELAVFLFVLWLVLAAAAWLQVSLGLRPLAGLRTDVLRMKSRPDERMTGAHLAEVAPLVEAINDLADTREADVRRARQRAADLAHGMKTPLAALAAQSRLIRGDSSISTEGLDRAIASATAAVEAELARARAAASRHEEQASETLPQRAIARLISVLERTEKGMRIDFVNEVPADLSVRVDEADLTEITGALLENATRFARREVTITGGAEDEAAWICIDDDGPGMTPEAAGKALARGVRLDERGAGHGLGLAIARELTDATGGTIDLSKANAGGLRVMLRWPV
ncbi:MAG: HAMP domain-containing sensor histidine kinase, partial [Pseudomonadota bacterium]